MDRMDAAVFIALMLVVIVILVSGIALIGI